MMRLLLTVLAIAVAVSCGTSHDAKLSDTEAKEVLENRNWMDVWPTSDREPLHVYRFTPAMGGGVYQDRTLYAGAFELFNYEIGVPNTDVVRIRWPHTKDVEQLKFSIEAVKGPEPFDLRLKFDGNLRGPSVFYGRQSETSASLRIE